MNMVVELQESLSHKVEKSKDFKLETREQTSLLRTYAQHLPLTEN